MRFGFVSTMASVPWGGSEVLWSSAAQNLAKLGHGVCASVPKWPQRAEPLERLNRDFGVEVREAGPSSSPVPRGLFARWRAPSHPDDNFAWLEQVKPDLLCISSGNAIEGLGWMQRAYDAQVPYVTVAQAHVEFLWPTDADADKYRRLFAAARRCFFVSKGNLTLVETQLAHAFDNAEVVFNPVNVSRDASPPWPSPEDGIWRLACVGRLHPPSKGQDLLFEVLARPEWRRRPIKLSMFGEGPHEQLLRRLASRHGLEGRVVFHGQVGDVEKIWAEHQALVLASRYEGLPLAIVEALLCGRPVIVTDVAGNAEIVEEGGTGFIAESPKVEHLANAMERAWAARHQWQEMGARAGREVRLRVPCDPGMLFAEKLLTLVGAGE